MIICNQCGTQNRDGAKFCANCQASLATSSQAAVNPLAIDKPSKLLPIGNVLLGLVCLIYLINPGAGFIELIPDNIPLIGNLDEGGATIGLLIALNNLGVINFQAEHWSQILPWLGGGKSK